MKRILLAIGLFLCGSVAHGACSGGSPTWTAASASNTDIAACVTAASSGDTILVPASGGVSFSSAVTVSKCVTINGQGAVTITSSADFILNEQATCLVRLTGFTFTNAGGNPPASDVIVNAAASTSGVRMDDCVFNASGTAIFDAVNGFGPVLFDHDTWTSGGASEQIHNLGAGAANTAGWTNTVVPGGPNMLFIEDSTFNNNVTTPILSVIESYYGAQTVIRHSIINGNAQIDQHGTSGEVGTRWFEFYDNQFFSQSTNQPSMVTIRGGSGVIWGNTADGTNTHGSAGMINLYCENSGTWPQQYCPGSGYNGITTPHSNCTTTNSAPVQIWGNNSNMGTPTNTGGTSPVVLNRDFFSNTSQPASIFWIENSTDTCSTTYTYTAYTYPNPLDTTGNVSLSPTALSYGNVPTGNTGLTLVTTLSNSSGSTITFSSLGQTGSYADFPYTTTCASFSGGTLTSGNSCTISVTFTPTGTPGFAETATFTLNYTGAAGSPLIANLTGTSAGVAAVAQLGPATGKLRLRSQRGTQPAPPPSSLTVFVTP